MTVRHMYIFKTVCECQSITAAAGKLNMTQPAVSVAIKELESFYQVKLFERMNRTIYLTEAGNTLREYADSILDQFEEAEAVLRDGTSMARCRLGVNVSVGETFLPGMLKLLEEKIPGIHMEVLVGNTVTIEEKLNENEREKGDIMLRNLARKNRWSRCPKCMFYVEKTCGCDEVRCRSVSHLIYYCLILFDLHPFSHTI